MYSQRNTCLLGETSICENLLDSKKPNHDTLNENAPAHSLNMVSKKNYITRNTLCGPRLTANWTK